MNYSGSAVHSQILRRRYEWISLPSNKRLQNGGTTGQSGHLMIPFGCGGSRGGSGGSVEPPKLNVM